MFENSKDSQAIATVPPPGCVNLLQPKPILAPLPPSQLVILRSTVPTLREHGEEIARLFYRNMLEAQPKLHNIFNQAGQTTGEQPRALAGAVLAYASHVDDLGQLDTLVERIAHKHVSLSVQPDQYEIVGKYLIEAVAIVLGDAATKEVVDAWRAAYAALASIFINREEQIYAAHSGWVGWRRFKIVMKVEETAEITSFYLVPEDGQDLPFFKPGQYISLRIPIPQLGYMQPRQYSLSEAPRSDYLRISVKKESVTSRTAPGSVSNALHNSYKEGDAVELTHPTGDFYVASNSAMSPLVLISAGVGATPLISILNSVISVGSERPVAWIHGARNPELQVFGSHISEVCSKHPNVQAAMFLSGSAASDLECGGYHHLEGRVSLDKVDQSRCLFLDNGSASYYICGPTKFMQDMQRYLYSHGVNMARINMEVFGVGSKF